MIGEISAALGSVNTAIQIAKAAIGVQQDVAVKLEVNKMLDAVLEAKGGLLAASETITKLQEELREANAKLAALTDLSRFEYRELLTGATIVAVKNGHQASEAEARMVFCPKCFEEKSLRLLQSETDDSYFRCFACTSLFKRDSREDEAIERANSSRHY
ncbi:hypothetical protein [Paraburkholderia phenazinium]|uniref:hypothetical protein n=1 Tax=Paraburkholderia phenazinium TaxID=60549 RepID=UPI001588A832|nr:hypothetical protein [Paraburkholderia phenazinium]